MMSTAHRMASLESHSGNQSQRKNKVDLNVLMSDPIHQFMMSDLSLKELKSNIQLNQVNRTS